MDFTTTPVFAKYHEIFQERKYRQIVLWGGSRSSKTYQLMVSMAIEMVKRPGLRITVWRNEKVTCRATVMEDFISVVNSQPLLQAIFERNKSQGSFTNTRNGAVILFEGADNPRKVHGLRQDISIFNEITEFNEQVYLQITQRTSETIFADYNPSKAFWFDRMKLRSDTIFIHSNFEDNPFLSDEIVAQLKSYEPWESGSYEVVDGVPIYNGQPISAFNRPPAHKKNVKEGTANEWMWLVYGLGIGAEKPNKIYHGWKRISRKEYAGLPYEENFGLDFGTANPTACVGVKWDGDNTIFIDEKIYLAMNQSLKPLHELLGEFLGNDDLLVCDSAKKTYITELRQHGFKAVAARKGQDSVNWGIEVVQSFNIYVTTRSQNIWEEYSTYSWDLDRYNKPTDKPLKKDDHIMDAIRYIITYLYIYYGITKHVKEA